MGLFSENFGSEFTKQPRHKGHLVGNGLFALFWSCLVKPKSVVFFFPKTGLDSISEIYKPFL